MKYVMRVEGFANGEPCPIAGRFMKRFDFDAHGGLGEGDFVADAREAMRFASKAEALGFWRTRSKVKPTRADGKPNRPLTSCHVGIEPLITEGERR